MTLDELEHLFRRDTGDKVKPYLFAQSDVRRWFGEAQDDAARRADLLQESDDPLLCQIPVSIGDGFSRLDPRWVRITRAAFVCTGSTDERPLEIVLDRRVLDAKRISWRLRTEQPRELLIEGGRMRFGCLPEATGTLHLEGFRLPEPMKDGKDEPEIDEQHHLQLVHGAMARAYLVPDSDMHDTGRAAAAEEAFSHWFGPRRDAQMGQDYEVATVNTGW